MRWKTSGSKQRKSPIARQTNAAYLEQNRPVLPSLHNRHIGICFG